MKKIILFATILFSTLTVFADELILTESEALAQGFQPQRWGTPLARAVVPYKQSLPWSFERPYAKAPMGNSFNQYQPYDQPGYHQGCDMIQESGSKVFSPVNGKLEAGHYGYSLVSNGDRVKQWKPWPAQGNPTYFEVAVIDDFGNRFEYHHVDRYSLPQEIVDMLNGKGEAIVKKGQALGEVIDWSTPFQYHHFHVNVYNVQGIAVNPESIFELIPDSKPPKVQFLAVYKDGNTEWLTDGAQISADKIESVIVTGADEKDANAYVQAPAYIEFSQGNKILSHVDFRTSLYDENKSFLDIRDFFPEIVKLPNGSKLRQMRDFYPLLGVAFNIRLKIKDQLADQPFTISVADMAGNTTKITTR